MIYSQIRKIRSNCTSSFIRKIGPYLSDFTTVTINNVLTDQLYNDLGFTVKNKLLILVEAQSTWSINIILRIVMYLAQTLKEYITARELNVYGSAKIEVPRPEFYVVYTGTDKKNVKEWYSLADEFFEGDNSFIDVKVRILQANESSKDIVSQYIAFTKVVNAQVKKLGRTEEAIREAIRICKDQDILREYLSKREQEVISIMTTLFSQEEATRMYGRQLQKQQAEKSAKETAERMIRAGKLTDQDIADYSGLTISQVKALREEMKTAVMA